MISTLAVLTFLMTLSDGQIAGTYERTAIVGKNISLPCHLKPEDPKDFVTLVLWYKGNTNVPLYSYDSRAEEKNSLAMHHSSDQLGQRGVFKIHEEPASLLIKNVLESDKGIYKCRVDFFHSRTLTYKVMLNVIAPPSEPVITDMSGKQLKKSIGPFNEGGNLHLICTVYTGNPEPVVGWFLNGKELNSAFERHKNGVVRNELFYKSLSRSDLHAEFECQASNNNITEPSRSLVLVELNLKPLTVQIATPKNSLSAKKLVKILCQSSGSRPPALITWLKGNRKMSGSENIVSEDNNISTSMLTFIPSSTDNGKYLSCRAENPNLPGSAQEDGWKLKVTFAPEITLINTYASLNSLKEGDSTDFKCLIQANPPVTDIKWFFRGRNVLEMLPHAVVKNHSLILRDIKRKHIGEYWCSATNQEGRRVSNKIKLNIKYLPRCVGSPRTLISIAVNSSAKIACKVDADPTDVNFSWTFNNSRIQFDFKNHSSVGTSSNATFVAKSSEQFGWLLCRAKNSVGWQKQPCIFIIREAVPPSKVENCMVINRTSTALHVKCKPGRNGGLSQEFYMEVFEKWTHVLMANISSSKSAEFIAKNLPSHKDFSIRIYASNRRGKSAFSFLNSSTLRDPQKQSGEKSSFVMTLIGIVIGVLASLLAIAICIVVMVRRKQNEENRYYDAHKAYNQRNHVQCGTLKQFNEERDPDIIPYLNSIEHSINRRKPANERIYSDTVSNMTENDDLMEYTSCTVKAVSQSPLNKNPNVASAQKKKHKGNYSSENKSENITFAELSVPLVDNRPSNRSRGHLNGTNNHVHFAEPHGKSNVRAHNDEERYPVTAETPLMDLVATESAV